jgi:hypothetical protein
MKTIVFFSVAGSNDSKRGTRLARFRLVVGKPTIEVEGVDNADAPCWRSVGAGRGLPDVDVLLAKALAKLAASLTKPDPAIVPIVGGDLWIELGAIDATAAAFPDPDPNNTEQARGWNGVA